MKLLISTPIAGGIGGMERSVYSICHALEGSEIDIYAKRIINNGFWPEGKLVKVYDLTAYLKKKSFQNIDYDIYIQYRTDSHYLIDMFFKAKVKLIIPAGNDVSSVEDKFDYVINEAADGNRYVKNPSKTILIPPPVFKLIDKLKKPENIPDKYYFTLFNPYILDRYYDDGLRPCKGYDILYEIVPKIKYPIVWGYNISTISDTLVRKQINLILKKNLSQEEIAYLYTNAQGYVCFSREEGFGWAIADSFIYNVPIFSRYIGVATLFNKNLINVYRNQGELLNMLNSIEYKKPNYDFAALRPENFRKRLLELISVTDCYL